MCIVGVSSSGSCESRSRHPSGRTALGRKRGDVGHAGCHTPAGRPHTVSAAAAPGVPASTTEVEGGFAPPWRPVEECAEQVPFNRIGRRSALAGPGNYGQRFAHLPSIMHTPTSGGRSLAGACQTFRGKSSTTRTRSRRIFWQLFLEFRFIAFGESVGGLCVGMMWRRLVATGATWRQRSRLEDVNREVKGLGVAVPGWVEHVCG